jgi:hypothetical protein
LRSKKHLIQKDPLKHGQEILLLFLNLLGKSLKFTMEKLGEFAPTRQFLGHTPAEKKAEPKKEDKK